MAEHAKLSPSSSERWLACPASLVRAPDVEDEGSEAAHEGTAAHAFAEFCLKNNINGRTAPFPADYAKYDTPELRDYIQTYLEYVMRIVVAEKGELFVEQKLNIFPNYEVFGTADAVVVGQNGTLHVIDLKYGRGVLVDVEENTQLLLYGIGGLGFDWLSPVPVTHVQVHIVQPRRQNLVAKTYTVEELSHWAAENTHLVKRAYDGTDEASPGAHCKWCPVKGTCRERAEHNLSLASFDFAAPEPACKSLDGLSEEELVKLFIALPTFRAWLNDIEAEVATRARAHLPDGLKWVAGRSARVVLDEEMAAMVLREQGINPYQEPKFLGITEIEKQLKLKGESVDSVLGKLVEKVVGKPALVPADDKRPAITPTASAQEDFS